MVKNEHGILLGHRTCWYAASQDWGDVKNWFFACRYKFRKDKNSFNNYWVDMVKNGWEHLDHESLKSGVFLKWFDELNRFTECYLDADSDKNNFRFNCIYTLYLWHVMLGAPCSLTFYQHFSSSALEKSFRN